MIKDSAIKELQETLKENLITSDAELAKYAVEGLAPQAVAVPGSVEEVASIVKVAAENNLALCVQGGGTKLDLGNRPEQLDLVLCTSRLNRITDMDTANLTVTVQAGVPFAELQKALSGQENRCYLAVSSDGSSPSEVCSEREHMGCFVPLDPPFSDRATLGGIVATNSSGPRRLLYGTIRDLLLGVRYVNAEGKVIGVGGKTVKNVSGYDVGKLMIGSMGTLGVICEMTLRLLPLPEKSATIVIGFDSIDDAFALVDKIMGSTLIPAALELFDMSVAETIGLGRDNESDYYVAVLAEGAWEVVDRVCSDAENMGKEAGGQKKLSLEGEGHLGFWRAYGELWGRSRGADSSSVVVRLSSPIGRLKELAAKAIKECQQLNLKGQIFAHAGSGVGRLVLRCTDGNKAFEKQIGKWMGQMLEACLTVGGNIVIERAEYPLKADLPVWGIARGEFEILKRIKQQIDPKRIFSPGRYVAGI